MSHWTHVRGIIEVDTMGRTTAESRFLAETAVNHLPRITGSEGPAKLYITTPEGHNVSSNTDENDNFSNLGDPFYHGLFEAQTKMLITVAGDLRDREFHTTFRETVKMLNRLASRLYIESCLLAITSDGDKTYTFTNPDYLYHMPVTDWTKNLIKYD